MITVTYELAQKMKDKWWKQDTELHWATWNGPNGSILRIAFGDEITKMELQYLRNFKHIPAPTADEIGWALKAAFIQFTVKYTLHETEPVFAYAIFTNNDIQTEKGAGFIATQKGVGSTIAEALATYGARYRRGNDITVDGALRGE